VIHTGPLCEQSGAVIIECRANGLPGRIRKFLQSRVDHTGTAKSSVSFQFVRNTLRCRFVRGTATLDAAFSVVIEPADEVVFASRSFEDTCHGLGPRISSVLVDERSDILGIVPNASSDPNGRNLLCVGQRPELARRDVELSSRLFARQQSWFVIECMFVQHVPVLSV
jgi:hypothetical protein